MLWLPAEVSNKHDTSTYCRTNVGSTSETSDQHWFNIVWMCRVCWVILVFSDADAVAGITPDKRWRNCGTMSQALARFSSIPVRTEADGLLFAVRW